MFTIEISFYMTDGRCVCRNMVMDKTRYSEFLSELTGFSRSFAGQLTKVSVCAKEETVIYLENGLEYQTLMLKGN